MSKIKRLMVGLVTLSVLLSSTPVLAMESNVSEDEVVQNYQTTDVRIIDEIKPNDAAPAISSATIEDILIDDDTGNVYAIVSVTGYGSAYGYIDGASVSLLQSTPVGSPVVTGFVYIFDCGVLSSGSHTFRYSGTSYNKPWNTVNRTATFNVP